MNLRSPGAAGQGITGIIATEHKANRFVEHREKATSVLRLKLLKSGRKQQNQVRAFKTYQSGATSEENLITSCLIPNRQNNGLGPEKNLEFVYFHCVLLDIEIFTA